MKKIVQSRELDSMPFDKAFYTESGNEELCHATGREVRFYGEDEFWEEYEDRFGKLHYGR